MAARAPKPIRQERAPKGRKPARKPRERPAPELVEEIPDDLWMDDADGEPDAFDPDDPFATPPEPEPEEPTGLESQHAEHMTLVESSKAIATPAAWLLLFLDGLLAIGVLVLVAAAIAAPDFAIELAGGALLAFVAAAAIGFSVAQGRKRFIRLAQACVFDIKRTVEPDRAVFGDVVSASLDCTASVLPRGITVNIQPRPEPGGETGRRIILKGADARTFPVKVTRRGVQNLGTTDVRMKDPGGLWRHTRAYEVDCHVETSPGMESLQLRNMLNSRTAFPDGAPKALVNLFRDIEHEQIRGYQGGDRMKDVDWKRMSSTGQMMVKDRIIESLDVGLLLIDAGTSMRLVDRGVRNLDLALEAASEIIQEAGRRNHQIGFLAFDDEEVLVEMPPTRSRMLYPEAQALFQKVAARHVEDRDRGKEALAVTFQRALRRMAGSRMGVLLLTDLESLDEGVIQVMARLGGDGAKVGVLLLPQPSMEAKRKAYRKHQTRPASGRYRGKSHRRELREVLSVQGIETMQLPR